MHELVLPSLEDRITFVTVADVNFQECCFAYAANCARNHCRAFGLIEADRLSNEAFFQWYNECVFPSADLLELMAIESQCRKNGFNQSTENVRQLALHYISALDGHLQNTVF